MERVPVTSSFINSIGYNSVNRMLEVEMSNGRVYEYGPGVSESEYRMLLDSSSVGDAFNRLIKPHYSVKPLFAHKG